MNTATQQHLSFLVRRLGNYSRVARHIGLDPRSLRKNRNGRISPGIKKLLTFAGQALFMRELVRELRRSKCVAPAELQRAARNVRARLHSAG